jgi:GTP-binding protein
MTPLLDTIVACVPPPRGARDAPFSMLVTMVEHDSYVGRLATGRVASGAVAEGDPIKLLPLAGGPASAGHKARRWPTHCGCCCSALSQSACGRKDCCKG